MRKFSNREASGGAGQDDDGYEYEVFSGAVEENPKLTRGDIADKLNNFYDKKPFDAMKIPRNLQQMHSLWFGEYNQSTRLDGLDGRDRDLAINKRREDIREVLGVSVEYLISLGIKDSMLRSFRDGSLLSDHLKTHAEEWQLELFMREFIAYLISLGSVSEATRLDSLESFPCGMNSEEFKCLEGSRERMAYVTTLLQLCDASFLDITTIEAHRSIIEGARNELQKFVYEGNQPHVFSALEYFVRVFSKTTHAKSVALDIPAIAAWNLIARYVEDFNSEIELKKESLKNDIRKILRDNPLVDAEGGAIKGVPANVREHLELMGLRGGRGKEDEIVNQLYNTDLNGWDEDNIGILVLSMQYPLATENREGISIPEDLFSSEAVPQIVSLIVGADSEIQRLGLEALLLTGRIIQAGSSFAQFLKIITELGARLSGDISGAVRFDISDDIERVVSELGIEEVSDEAAAGCVSSKVTFFYEGLKALRAIVEKSPDDLKVALSTILSSFDLERDRGGIAYVGGTSNLSLLLKYNAGFEDIKGRMMVLNRDESEEGIETKKSEVQNAMKYMFEDDDEGCKITSEQKFRNLVHNQGFETIILSIFGNDDVILNDDEFILFAAELIYYAAKYRAPDIIRTMIRLYPEKINDYIFDSKTSPFLSLVDRERGPHNILYHMAVVDKFTDDDGEYNKEKSLLMGGDDCLNIGNTDLLFLFDIDGYTLVQRLVVENKIGVLKSILSCVDDTKRLELVNQLSESKKSLMELAIESGDANYGIVSYLASINPKLLALPGSDGNIPIHYLATKIDSKFLIRLLKDINQELRTEIISITNNLGMTILDYAISTRKVDWEFVDYLMSINPRLNLCDTLSKSNAQGTANIISLAIGENLDILKGLLNKLPSEEQKSLICEKLHYVSGHEGHSRFLSARKSPDTSVIDVAYGVKNYKMIKYLASIAPEEVLIIKSLNAYDGMTIITNIIIDLLNKGDVKNLTLMLTEPLSEEQRRITFGSLLHWCMNSSPSRASFPIDHVVTQDMADLAIGFLYEGKHINAGNIFDILSRAHKLDNHRIIKSIIARAASTDITILKEVLNNCVSQKKWSLVIALAEVCDLRIVKVDINSRVTVPILHCLAKSDQFQYYEETAMLALNREQERYDISAMIEDLIAKGVCDVDCEDSRKFTPLRIASYENIGVLLRNGAYKDIEVTLCHLLSNQPAAESNKALNRKSIEELKPFNEFKQISKLIVEYICESSRHIVIDPDTQFRVGRLIHRNLITIYECNIDKLKEGLNISDIVFGTDPAIIKDTYMKEKPIFCGLVSAIADNFSAIIEAANKESSDCTISITEEKLLEVQKGVYESIVLINHKVSNSPVKVTGVHVAAPAADLHRK